MSNNDAYLGNPNLKKVNTPVEFTKDEGMIDGNVEKDIGILIKNNNDQKVVIEEIENFNNKQ